jgi:hypothetical protein
MRTATRSVVFLCSVMLLLAGAAGAADAPLAPKRGAHHNFQTSIYITVGTTRQLANRRTLEEQYSRIASQLRFDKVYLEVYRNGQFADEGSLQAIKQFFMDRGITVSGGVMLAAGGQGGRFGPSTSSRHRTARSINVRWSSPRGISTKSSSTSSSSIPPRAMLILPPRGNVAGRSTGWRKCASYTGTESRDPQITQLAWASEP